MSTGHDRGEAFPGRTGSTTSRATRTPGLHEALGNHALLRLLASDHRTGTQPPGSARRPGLRDGLGNHALLRLLSSGVLRATSDLSRPGDPLEAEADRVARAVVSPTGAPAPARTTGDAPPTTVAPGPAGTPPAMDDALRSTGRPLDPVTRDFMEERFGLDFGRVRVHTGPAAEAATGAIQARAFTVGSDVVSGRSLTDPGLGRELLAHELTHVVQKGHAPPRASAPGGPWISRAGCATGVLRAADPVEQTAAGPDYARLAVQIRKAIVGLGTDEEAVYRALRELGRDANKIARLEAIYLAQFGDSLEDDIRGDFSGSELDAALILISSTALQLAARRIRTAVEGFGTDEDAIYQTLNSLGRDQTRIRQLKEVYQGLYREDLVTRIHEEMSGGELGFALHLLRQPTARQMGVAAEGERISAEMTQTGTRMHWAPSGPGAPATDFWTWASAPSEGPLPPIAMTTTMNCWEVVLLVAYRQGAVSWKWIHDVYVSNPSGWSENLVEKMSSGMQIPYAPSDNPPRIPIRGDIVFFEGAAHVALATGARDGMGRTRVLSFWPPPDVVPYTAGTLDKVKVTTIEELVAFMSGASMKHEVTYATPPW